MEARKRDMEDMRKEISELISNQEHMLKASKYLDEQIVEKQGMTMQKMWKTYWKAKK